MFIAMRNKRHGAPIERDVSVNECYKHVAPPEQKRNRIPLERKPEFQRRRMEGIKKRGGFFAVRRANYTHRRKGVFNARSIVHL